MLWGHHKRPGERAMAAAAAISTSLSYRGTVANIQGAERVVPLSLHLSHTYSKVVGSNPKISKKLLGRKNNCLGEGMIYNDH